MSKWKATMPRELPAEGKVDVVFAHRGAAGSRMEIHGAFDKTVVGRLFGAMTQLAAGPVVAVATALVDRDSRQAQVIRWCARTFGEAVAVDKRERAERFLEEALELAQACGVDVARVSSISRHVYSKPVGEIDQEIGGVGVTLLALAENYGISADMAERNELTRVLRKDPAHFRARQDAKAAAGVARASE